MSDKFDKAKALVVCFQNLKGAKSKDLPAYRTSVCSTSKHSPSSDLTRVVGEAVGVSGEMVRQFLGLLELPIPVQDYLAQGTLGLEHGRRLGQLAKSRPEVVEQAAAAHDQHDSYGESGPD